MDNEDKRWQRIQDHCNKVTAEALAIQIAEFKTWEAPESMHAKLTGLVGDCDKGGLDKFYADDMGL